MNEIKVIQSELGKEIIVRVVHSRFDEDAWIGLFKAGSGDNEHGDRWKWMRDVDVSHITLPAQGAGEWSVRLFKDGGYERISSLDFHVTNSHSSINQADAESNKRPVIIAFVVGITLFSMGLPLLIIGSTSTGEDKLAMLVPGAVMFCIGAFMTVVAAAIGMGFGKSVTKTASMPPTIDRFPSAILVSEHSFPKYNGTYTIQNNEINGKPWFKNNSGCILYFYNANSGGAPSWSLDDRSQDGTNDWFRGGWIEPPNSGGPPLGTRSWEEAGTIKMKSVRHRNISAETETRHDQHLHDPVKAAEFASALGLMVGGAGHPFVGDWGVKGLYAYRSGKYKGIAYFGTGGSESDRLKDTYNPEKHGESQQKYRPWNRDDPKIPEDIRQKLIRLEDKNSTRMNQTSQPSSSGTLQGEIALKSVHGKYLSATPEGRVEWDDDVAQVGEYFRVEQRKNGKIALRSAFDMYVSAQSDGNVECNRREAPPGGWEEFTVEYRSNDVVCLKSCHGKYLSAQPDGTAQWNRDHAPRSGWEEIRIEQYRKTSEPILSEAILNSDQKYVFAPEHKGWHWHNDRARAMGGHIASITSAEENEHITQISGGAPVWLGGIRKGARYRGKPIADRKGGEIGEVGPGAEDWYWSDGRPWSYTNWGPGEPNNWDAGENRVQHLGKFDAVWNDVGEDWEGPAVYLVPNIASATSKSTSPEIDILSKFKSRLDISDASDDFFTTDDYFDDLSSKFNKK